MEQQCDQNNNSSQKSSSYNGESFEIIVKTMIDVAHGGGLIKKRILKEGKGPVVPKQSNVYFNYSAYKEFNTCPVASTYYRRREESTRLDTNYMITGLKLAILTMKVDEKAEFLIHKSFLQGKLEDLKHEARQSDLLFEVVLKRYESLEDVLKANSFMKNYKHAYALCNKGNADIQLNYNYSSAVRTYNEAVSILENLDIKDGNEAKKQVDLLMHLYTNLAVANVYLGKPKFVCVDCNKVYKLCKKHNLHIPPKVQFNHAKALIELNDIVHAEIFLRKASKSSPDSYEIQNCFAELNKIKERNAMYYKQLNAGFVGFAEPIDLDANK